MAPLKFRAWHKIFQEMFFVSALMEDHNEKLDTIRSHSALNYDHVDGGIWEVDADDCVVMQSTGLHDKNGEEIFEGDIVKWGSWHVKSAMARHEKLKKINVVVWNQRKGSWQTDHDDVWEVGIYSDIEVIGNIWENPDLLPKAA